ncbi:hypothetical protein Tco_1557430, partial [Tanacetum coccineum]
DERMKFVSDKVDTLEVDFVEIALHLEEKFYPHFLTTISSHRWLLSQGMELAVIKCLNSPKYLFALGAAISKAIEKGMHDGLDAGITHALRDVFVPLAKPSTAAVLIGNTGISNTVPADAATTTTLSTLVISTSSIPSITVEDYEVTNTYGQGSSQDKGEGSIASIIEIDFEKEEMDTTP